MGNQVKYTDTYLREAVIDVVRKKFRSYTFGGEVALEEYFPSRGLGIDYYITLDGHRIGQIVVGSIKEAKYLLKIEVLGLQYEDYAWHCGRSTASEQRTDKDILDVFDELEGAYYLWKFLSRRRYALGRVVNVREDE